MLNGKTLGTFVATVQKTYSLEDRLAIVAVTNKVFDEKEGFVECKELIVQAFLDNFHEFYMGEFRPMWVHTNPQVPPDKTKIVMEILEVNPPDSQADVAYIGSMWGSYDSYMKTVAKMAKTDLYRVEFRFPGIEKWVPDIRFRDRRLLAIVIDKMFLEFAIHLDSNRARLSKMVGRKWVAEKDNSLLREITRNREKLIEDFNKEFELTRKVTAV